MLRLRQGALVGREPLVMFAHVTPGFALRRVFARVLLIAASALVTAAERVEG